MQLLSEKDKERTGFIEQEMQGGNFEKAMDLTRGYIEENRGKVPFSEAHYEDLAASIIVRKFKEDRAADPNLVGLPIADYALARKHLDRCLELYQTLEKNARNDLLIANLYCKMAHLAFIAETPEEGLRESQESLRMFRFHNYQVGIKSATDAWYALRTQKLHLEMMDIVRHFNEDPEANRERLMAANERMQKLQDELQSS